MTSPDFEARIDRLLTEMQTRHHRFNLSWRNHHLREGMVLGYEEGRRAGLEEVADMFENEECHNHEQYNAPCIAARVRDLIGEKK